MDYSVKNTNKEQRRDLVKKALTISISGADVPTKETIELAKKYIDGSIELEDFFKVDITNVYPELFFFEGGKTNVSVDL